MTDFIDKLPTIISYFLPGYIGLKIFLSVSGIKLHEYEKYPIACALSYCIVGLIELGRNSFVSTNSPVSVWVFILATIISIFIGYGAAVVFYSEPFRNFLADKFKYSPAVDTWENTYDYKRGSQVMLKMKNGKYIRGVITSVGNVSSDPWMALSNYDVITAERNVELETACKDERLIININDVEYACMSPLDIYDEKIPEK